MKNSDITWEVYSPVFNEMKDAGCIPSHVPSWLEEIRTLRGSVLYENGRRPAFRSSDGRFVDADHLDFIAYHVAVKMGGRLIGGCRLVPMGKVIRCAVDEFLGVSRVDEMLSSLAVCRHGALEGGRWVIDPEHRKVGLAFQIAMAAWVVARRLGSSVVLCAVGTEAGQDRSLARCGYQYVPGIDSFRCEVFRDTLRMMYAPVQQHPTELGGSLDQIEQTLRWVSRRRQ